MCRPNPLTPPPQSALAGLTDSYRRGEMQQVIVDAGLLLDRHAGVEAVYVFMGAAHLSLKQYAEAEATFRRALAAGIRQAGIHSNLGMAIAGQGRHEEALESYRTAIALDPGRASAHNNLGNALTSCGHLPEAIEAYAQATTLDPAYADAFNNMGMALEMAGRGEEALAAYARAISINPGHAGALNNLGNVRNGLGDLSGAIVCYEQAIALRPNYAEALNNLANVYRGQGRYDDAIATYQRATVADPGFVHAWVELGKTLGMLGQTDMAAATFGHALAIDPNHVIALSHRLFYQAQACDWTAFDDWTRVPSALSTQFPPFIALAFEDDPERQLARSRSWVTKHYSPVGAGAWQPELAPDGRIRVGYFSADFHNHATLFLMAGMLRAHDRSRFSIHAFSYGTTAGGEMRDTLLNHVDGFHEVSAMSDGEIAELARALGLDIAVDLKGHTQNSRVQLFANRLAPVQVGFLGYPGTSGVDAMDYVIADRVVVPEAMSASFSERLLLLPDSYQPNDNARRIAEVLPSRAECGLPDNGFVFCCFNQSYKITPREFAIWMRLLDRVEGSVLWLLEWNPSATQNLRREAEARGVAPDRLVCADHRSQAEHLSRLRQADLIVDTFNVNAHTTASDALWAGVPVVTLAGRQFAARVCASLLEAIGLPELVTVTEQDYEALCLALASEPGRMAALRTRLDANRLTKPLFDTTRYVRNLEAVLVQAHECGSSR